jgi:hypothetical protein
MAEAGSDESITQELLFRLIRSLSFRDISRGKPMGYFASPSPALQSPPIPGEFSLRDYDGIIVSKGLEALLCIWRSGGAIPFLDITPFASGNLILLGIACRRWMSLNAKFRLSVKRRSLKGSNHSGGSSFSIVRRDAYLPLCIPDLSPLHSQKS